MLIDLQCMTRVLVLSNSLCTLTWFSIASFIARKDGIIRISSQHSGHLMVPFFIEPRLGSETTFMYISFSCSLFSSHNISTKSVFSMFSFPKL